MLGLEVSDPEGVEGGGSVRGLGLLPVKTVLVGNKRTEQFRGKICSAEGILSELEGLCIEGYEIHMGVTGPECGSDCAVFTSDSTGMNTGNVYGTYIHGVFDRGEVAETVVRALAERKGIEYAGGDAVDHREFKEKEFDRLADILRKSLDMDRIYDMLRESDIKDNES